MVQDRGIDPQGIPWERLDTSREVMRSASKFTMMNLRELEFFRTTEEIDFETIHILRTYSKIKERLHNLPTNHRSNSIQLTRYEDAV